MTFPIGDTQGTQGCKLPKVNLTNTRISLQ